MTSDKTRPANIYKLVNMITNEIYIGATFQPLHKRHYDRKKGYNTWLRGMKYSNKHKLFSNIYEYGWEAFRMELIKEVEVSSKAELHAIEGDYIRKLDTYKNGLNGRLENLNVKGNKKQYNQQYRKDNKDKIKHRNKQYREANKNRNKCKACGYSCCNKRDFTRHCKSKKHQKNIAK